MSANVFRLFTEISSLCVTWSMSLSTTTLIVTANAMCIMRCTLVTGGGQYRFTLICQASPCANDVMVDKPWRMLTRCNCHPDYPFLWQDATHTPSWEVSIPCICHNWQYTEGHPSKAIMPHPNADRLHSNLMPWANWQHDSLMAHSQQCLPLLYASYPGPD